MPNLSALETPFPPDMLVKLGTAHFRTLEDLLLSFIESLDGWCCLYISPSEGGGMLTGPTVALGIKDRGRLAKALETVAHLAELAANPQVNAKGGKAASEESAIRKLRFADRDIYYMVHSNREPSSDLAIGTVTWCATDRALVFAMSPQGVKAYLLREPERATLAEEPAVAEIVRGKNPPTVLEYDDSRQTLAAVYPLIQPFLALLAAQESGHRGGPDPTLLPAMPTIAKYVRPSVATIRLTPEGVVLSERESLPGGNLLAALWVGLVSCSPTDLKVWDKLRNSTATDLPAEPLAQPAADAKPKDGEKVKPSVDGQLHERLKTYKESPCGAKAAEKPPAPAPAKKPLPPGVGELDPRATPNGSTDKYWDRVRYERTPVLRPPDRRDARPGAGPRFGRRSDSRPGKGPAGQGRNRRAQ